MRRNDLARKITSWLTLGIFSLQPSLSFAADIVADDAAPEAQRPYVTETASGVPLVQIARPDGGDVSVNRYEAFSVPERGAILNMLLHILHFHLRSITKHHHHAHGHARDFAHPCE